MPAKSQALGIDVRRFATTVSEKTAGPSDQPRGAGACTSVQVVEI